MMFISKRPAAQGGLRRLDRRNGRWGDATPATTMLAAIPAALRCRGRQ
jgi:hypothetical protein